MKQRKTIRLSGYDYSTDNLYFITSCVQNRICCFGEIHNATDPVLGTGRDPSPGQIMILNNYGEIAEKQWYWLSEQYPYVILHAFVVMPNHIHGIIEINRRDPSLPRQIKIKSLSELMGAYKTTVSKQIHLAGYKEFTWQRSFYDCIIRNEKSFKTISEYINANPLKWKEDNLYYQRRHLASDSKN